MSKIKKEKINFTQVSNKILNDERLSFKAKGIYAFIFSKPDGWKFAIKRIAKQTLDGYDSIKSGISELEKIGYLERIKQTSGKMEYYLKTKIRKIPIAGNPNQGKSQPGKIPTISNKENIVIKNNSNKDIALSKNDNAVNKIFDLFYQSINPGINFGNKTSREAVEWFIRQWGEEQSTRMFKQVIEAQKKGDKFCPVATTPYQVKIKLGDFKIYFEKKRNNLKKVGFVS